MDIEITNKKENPAFHRTEIEFIIRHMGEGTPNRVDVRDKLAAMETADTDLTFIVSMMPRFGIPEIHGTARVYDDLAIANEVELSYVRIRNMPKDKRDDAWKAAKAKRKRK